MRTRTFLAVPIVPAIVAMLSNTATLADTIPTPADAAANRDTPMLDSADDLLSSGELMLRVDPAGDQLLPSLGSAPSESPGSEVTNAEPATTMPLAEDSLFFGTASRVASPAGGTQTAVFSSWGIPEPATLTLLLAGGTAWGILRRKL